MPAYFLVQLEILQGLIAILGLFCEKGLWAPVLLTVWQFLKTLSRKISSQVKWEEKRIITLHCGLQQNSVYWM